MFSAVFWKATWFGRPTLRQAEGQGQVIFIAQKWEHKYYKQGNNNNTIPSLHGSGNEGVGENK
jgi:hypothetical protein